MILKQGHTYEPMPHDGKVIRRIYRGGRCYYKDSPYSLAATQALKAAFPQYWTAIRDYGYAHPQLVPFINQYPMLAGSLVEMGDQKVVMDFNGTCKFMTDIIPNQESDELYLSYKVENDKNCFGWGIEDSWSSNINAFHCGPWASNGCFWYHNEGGFRNTGTLRSAKVGQWVTLFITKSRCGILGEDESNLGIGAAGQFGDSAFVYLECNDSMRVSEAIMNRNGSNLIRLLPAEDNVMFDIVRGIAIQNIGDGNSTISIITDKP